MNRLLARSSLPRLHVARCLTSLPLPVSQFQGSAHPVRPAGSSQRRLFSSETNANKPEGGGGDGGGLIEKYFGKDSCEASPTFTNRWSMVVPVFLTQLSIGSTWAWSLMV
jgi:hypothetical protein